LGNRLSGKVAIVTGAGRGIGNGIARALAREGAKVLVVDIDEKTAKDAVETITKAGGTASSMRADLSKKTDADSVASAAVERYGRIDILCQNVGIYPRVAFEKMTEADWDRVMSVNLKSAFFILKSCLPTMEKQRYGKVVITSSITGPRTAIPGLAHYAASKGGLNGLLKAVALEEGKYNITVNGVEPGTILTEGVRDLYAGGATEQPVDRIPLGRLGTADDIAGAALFLASDDSRYVTGQNVIVDGGQTIVE